jgi:hypothetical protein
VIHDKKNSKWPCRCPSLSVADPKDFVAGSATLLTLRMKGGERLRCNESSFNKTSSYEMLASNGEAIYQFYEENIPSIPLLIP